MKNKIRNILLSIYENPENSASFSSIKKLYNKAIKLHPQISLKDVKFFLKSQDSYTKHKLTPRKHEFQKVIAAKPKIIVGMDLLDVRDLSLYNNNVNFIMFFVDLYSKKITAVPLKNKSKESILQGLTDFFKIRDNKLYSRIFSDKESGLYSNLVKTFLEKHKKRVYTNSSYEQKNSVTERNLKTLKSKIYRYLTHYNTYNYLPVLQDIVSSINNSSHSSLKDNKMTPNILHEIDNPHYLRYFFKKMFITQKSRKFNQSLNVGEYVRIPKTSRHQNIFSKKFKPVNTDEIFVIKSIDNRRQPPLFKLKDLANQNIIGSFYKEELTPSILKKIYPIKILKTKILANGKKKFYVAYEGWPSQFNEWIASNNILTYDHEKKNQKKIKK